MVLAVIPNYNGGDAVLRCIESVKKQSYSPIEIIVVDNSSSDNSLQAIKDRFSDITCIETGYNAGWGIACNIGMAHSNSRYIALLNNDAWIEENCIAEMVKAIELKPEYGSCASKILLGDGSDTVEACGLVIAKDGSSCGRGRLKPPSEYDAMAEIFCANDCVCLYKREMITEIGEYDPDFFIYCDETDMGFRHQIAGWKCIYQPTAVAHHAHSKSAGSYSNFKAFYVERNRIFLLLKYFPLGLMLKGFACSIIRYSFQFGISLTHKKGALARYLENHSIFSGIGILLKAHLYALFKAPTMLKRRAQMVKLRRISNQEFRMLFTRFGISLKSMASYE